MQKEALIMQLIMSFLLWMRLVLLIPGRKAATANRAGGGSPLYEVSAVEEFAGQQGFEAKLVLSGGFGDDALGQDISPLSFIVRVEKSTQLRVYISDAKNPRWEIPHNLIPRQKIDSNLAASTDSPLLFVTHTIKPFGFAVTRVSNGDVLFNSTPPGDTSNLLFNPIIFKDQYIEISSQLPQSSNLFGLGESTRSDGLKLKPNRTYTLWTTDIAALFGDVDLYGSWPFHIEVRERGVSHGVLLLNSNGMEISYTEKYLTYRVIGGVLDFYFFPGPTPLDVVDQFTQLVGRPAAQPYWSFGFHQCRWGYRNVSIVKQVVENFRKAKIPLDTMWNDID
ncbi:putative alpha-xylosidase 2 [Physcomitrium patens]|uniref:Maltase n=1 Tax=Physcomitrium patens TaxID=3218 RepID=A0A7I4CZP9_PHYPA|nr:putative alpha-xylosidase 2 [Physcomitrium patens]|eukprot:XP_024359572.1 putative alpha-xylosidase 2 [Physcomitrella patens]